MVEGSFYLVFLANGIESRRTDEIKITIDRIRNSIFPETFELAWSIITMIVIIFINSPYLNKFSHIAPILVVLLEVIVIQQSNKGIAFQITSFVIMGLMLFLNCKILREDINQNINPNFYSD